MKWVLLVLLTIVLSFLVLFLTGHCRRTYATLMPDDEVVMEGQSVKVADLARRYQPQLFMPQGAYSPPALGMWYEVIDQDARLPADQVALVYRARWQDEVHPLPPVDWLYRVFRSVYYGYPPRDIEYVQINVNRVDGQVEKVRFEMGPEGAYDRRLSEHLMVTITRTGDGAYVREVATRAGQVLSCDEPVVLPGDGQLAFGIQTWNHLLVFLSPGEQGQYTVPQPMALEYMSDQDYVANKSCRKGQGDFAVQENQVWVALPLLVVSLVTVVPLVTRIWQLVQARRQRRK